MFHFKKIGNKKGDNYLMRDISKHFSDENAKSYTPGLAWVHASKMIVPHTAAQVTLQGPNKFIPRKLNKTLQSLE